MLFNRISPSHFRNMVKAALLLNHPIICVFITTSPVAPIFIVVYKLSPSLIKVPSLDCLNAWLNVEGFEETH